MTPSQARKLGLGADLRVALDEPPAGWTLQEPRDVVQEEGTDVIIAFFTQASDLPARLPSLSRRVYPAGAIWAAWPRRAAGHHSDITDNIVREHALPLGLVDIKVAAIDDDWSGLRLVWRRELRK